MDLTTELENIAKTLNQSNLYRVIKKFERREQYHFYENEENKSDKLIGIYLDTETTGLDYKNDKIIELALVPFEYNLDGKVFRILDGYSGFQDPGILLNEQITLLTGITDDMVKGQIIDHNKVNTIVESASLIIAHNANFDRKFVESQFPIFKQKSWGCSYTQVSWRQENIVSAKLEYLAYKFGFFYDAHRAEMDCLVGVHLLNQVLPLSGELVFKELLKNAQKESYIIWAFNAPFSSREILKKRGYRWNDGNNGKLKSWYIEVIDEIKEKELNFLEQNIYQSKTEIKIDRINSFNRFSDR
jgi:DNA polymerase-3 subunit epsilon